jgi:SLAP domain-containing protein
VCFDLPPNAQLSQSVKIQYQSLPENTTESQKQELERVLSELPPMKQGEVNVSPLHAQITPQRDLLATVVIRNSTDKTVSLEQIPLTVFDAHQEELIRGLFNIKDLAIESFKAILWTFNFGAVLQDKDIDLSSWHINITQ